MKNNNDMVKSLISEKIGEISLKIADKCIKKSMMFNIYEVKIPEELKEQMGVEGNGGL